MNLPQEPLGIRRTGFSPVMRYSCRHSHSTGVHGSLAPAASPPRPPSPDHTRRRLGGVLSPATLSARSHLTSELLRTLSRMAASKPTSWLSRQPHILSHSAHAQGP